MGQDLRTGLRRLIRRPGFTLLAAGILALGLSTSTAVFTYVNAYRRTLPGVNAKNLHQVWFATEQDPWGPLSIPDYEDLVERGGSEFFVGGVGQSSFGATVRRDREAEVAFGESVTGSFFSVAGVQMSVGRGIAPEDDLPGAAPVTVLAYEYWVSRYGADPDVPGQIILLNNEPYPRDAGHGRRGERESTQVAAGNTRPARIRPDRDRRGARLRSGPRPSHPGDRAQRGHRLRYAADPVQLREHEQHGRADR